MKLLGFISKAIKLILTGFVGQCRNILPLAFFALTSLLSVNTEKATGNIFLHWSTNSADKSILLHAIRLVWEPHRLYTKIWLVESQSSYGFTGLCVFPYEDWLPCSHILLIWMFWITLSESKKTPKQYFVKICMKILQKFLQKLGKVIGKLENCQESVKTCF